MTQEQLRKVLQMKCFTVSDLRDIARELNIEVDLGQSYKKTFKNLASQIHEIYNLHFAMVEGLHRICTVRNLLEGSWSTDSEEPNINNIFLKKQVQIRIHIHSDLTSEVKEEYRSLSLFNLKVKRSIVERTLYDELSHIANQMQNDDKLLPLNATEIMFKQLAKCTSPIHILYNHRYYIYETIANFAFDKNSSTELYKFQAKHLDTVIKSENIPDKKRYLNLSVEDSITSDSLFLRVAQIAKDNLCKKAESFSTLHTKKECRIMDWTMKPISQEIRVVITYFALAAINMKCLNESIKLLSPRYKFGTAQTRNEIDVLATMYSVVQAVDEVGDAFKERIVDKDVHVTKIKQLIKMNIFRDLMCALKKFGHHPVVINEKIKNKFSVLDNDIQSSPFIDLVTVWSIACRRFILNTNESVIIDGWFQEYNAKLFSGMSKTDVKNGKFGCQAFDEYNINEKLRLTYWVEHPEFTDFVDKLNHATIARKRMSSLNSPEGKQLLKKPKLDNENTSVYAILQTDCEIEETDDDYELVDTDENSNMAENEESDNEASVLNSKMRDKDESDNEEIDHDENLIQVKNKRSKPTTIDDNVDTEKLKHKKSRNNKKKHSDAESQRDDNDKVKYKRVVNSSAIKNIFTAPKRVQDYYDQMIRREVLSLPVAEDFARVKSAWVYTINSFVTITDIKRMWVTFADKLFEPVSELKGQ